MTEHQGLSVCSHCGAAWDERHAAEGCSVAGATRRILEGYRPRGATAGFECPNGHGDGVWHWWPPTGAQGFSCEVCGAVVDHYTGEPLDWSEQTRRLAEREARQMPPPRSEQTRKRRSLRGPLARLRQLTSRGQSGA